ncbi:MAG TPA: carboxypeptidase regulatory-like domain-containing protein [Pirellulales bacterium]|nr:carboxypeptidase regulatory-like domain-containing protein [Pirellulales bacterium]
MNVQNRVTDRADHLTDIRMLIGQCRAAIFMLASALCCIAAAEGPKAGESGASNAAAQDEPVTVLCVDRAGKPVVGAEVHLFQAVAGEPVRYKQFGPFVSDEKGRAACPRAVPTDGDGHFDRWAYARVPGRLVGVGRTANWKGRSRINAEFRVQLEPSRTVEGVVTVPDGFDVTRVTVHTQVLHINTGSGDFDYQSFPRHLPFAGLHTAFPEIFDKQPDAAGHVRFDDVPVQGSLYLLTVGEELAEAQWRNENKRFDEPIRLAVAKEGVLAGRVELPDGTPAVGMRVAASLSAGPLGVFFLSTFEAVTDDDGRFAVHALPAVPFDLSVRDPSRRWIMRPIERLSVANGETKEVAFSMETGVDVSGRVVDADGKPVEAAYVVALTDTQPGSGLADDGTDGDGRYRLRLPSGRAKLYFSGLPSGFIYPEPRIMKRLEITAGQDAVENLDFTLYRNASEAEAARGAKKLEAAAGKPVKPDPAVAARVKKIAQENAQREQQFRADLRAAQHDQQKVQDANNRYFADKQARAEDLNFVISEHATDPAAFEAVLVLVCEMQYFLDDSQVSIVLNDHLEKPGMGRLCFALRYRGGEVWAARILKAVAERHPQREVRGQAIFALGDYYRREAFPWGRELPEEAKAPLLADAGRFYQQTFDEFAELPTPDGKATLGEKAKHELARLKNLPDLKIGRPAPPITGEALDGKPMSLADHRGQVVLLVFWGSWCGPCMRMVPHERELAKRYRGKPFALLGVNCGDTRELALATMEAKQMAWRCWWDGEETNGPIETDYDVPHWPRVFVIDTEGIIRAIDPEADELDRVIEGLVKVDTDTQ